MGQLDDATFWCLALSNYPGDRLKEQSVSVICVDCEEFLRVFSGADAYWGTAPTWTQSPKDVFDMAGMAQINSSDQARKLVLVANLPDETVDAGHLNWRDCDGHKSVVVGEAVYPIVLQGPNLGNCISMVCPLD